MWAWFVGGYAVFFAVIAGCPALVACCARDAKQRKDALAVLKYVAPGGLGLGAVVGVVLRLHQAGLW